MVHARIAFVALTLVVLPLEALAETASAEKAEETARNSFLQHFTTFAQTKNVIGKPKDATGKVKPGGKKKDFNRDDGAPFQSDLTYHDLSFNTIETEQDPNDKDGKNSKTSRLFAFVSSHGAISGAAGSSELERKAYQLHKQFTKQDSEENFKKDDEEKGIKFRSIFKISTQEVIKADDQGGNNKDKDGKSKQEADKVERFEMRDEARVAIEKVGEDSFEDVRKAAKTEEGQKDGTTLANGVLLRYAAAEATQSLWNSTLANLIQRRVNRGIKAGKFPDTPQLSEKTPTCGAWANTANGVLGQLKDPGRRKELQEEVTRMQQQCQQLAGIKYDAIDPRFETNKDGKDELKINGPEKEDGLIRDMRVQLGVLEKAGVSASSIKSNWRYDRKDDQTKQTINFDANGQPLGESTMTVAEQLESYNKQLRAAAEGVEDVQKRMPGLKMDTAAILDFQIRPGTKSVMEINQLGLKTLADETGQAFKAEGVAKTYGELQSNALGTVAGPVIRGSVATPVTVEPGASNGFPRASEGIRIDDRQAN